ncbi:MAG: hypothetical protein U5L72_19540 [Bacteroidales bacterium]|nr:hypothetical protein [Bacteroidales bacterium]
MASSLIAVGTSLKLPLSTTYVTFVVAMGTSLADGAWGREKCSLQDNGGGHGDGRQWFYCDYRIRWPF